VYSKVAAEYAAVKTRKFGGDRRKEVRESSELNRSLLAVVQRQMCQPLSRVDLNDWSREYRAPRCD
jgi:hypothetical protein